MAPALRRLIVLAPELRDDVHAALVGHVDAVAAVVAADIVSKALSIVAHQSSPTSGMVSCSITFARISGGSQAYSFGV
jgi:hypothetical protein